MNTKNLARLLLVGAAIGLVSSLGAQTSSDTPRGPRGGRGPGGPGGPGGRGHPIIRAIDADRDGVISASELANAPAAIRALDTNHDGTVSVDELRPPRPADAPTPPADAPARPDRPARPADPVMLALDANGDGALSATEINNASASLAALDANKDGRLTADEFRPLPPAN